MPKMFREWDDILYLTVWCLSTLFLIFGGVFFVLDYWIIACYFMVIGILMADINILWFWAYQSIKSLRKLEEVERKHSQILNYIKGVM